MGIFDIFRRKKEVEKSVSKVTKPVRKKVRKRKKLTKSKPIKTEHTTGSYDITRYDKMLSTFQKTVESLRLQYSQLIDEKNNTINVLNTRVGKLEGDLDQLKNTSVQIEQKGMITDWNNQIINILKRAKAYEVNKGLKNKQIAGMLGNKSISRTNDFLIKMRDNKDIEFQKVGKANVYYLKGDKDGK